MQSLRQDWIQTGVLSALSAGLFYVFFLLNQWLMASMSHSDSVNWVFLPAGLRVILTLVMGFSGALGIVLGSWAVGLSDGQDWSLLLVGNGLISGLTPWLVMRWVMQGSDFRHRLHLLTPQRLLVFVFVYAIANALFHHLFWWLLTPLTLAALDGLLPMAVGDTLGALLLLYLLKWILGRWPLPTPERN
jgi:hypothetical protein